MRFKKRLRKIIIVLFYLISHFCPAQEHMIEVKRYPDYAKDYLTLIDAGMFNYTNNEENIVCSYKLDLDRMSRTVFKDTTFFYWPQSGWVITEINGISTKYMTEETFYSILDNQDSVHLNILRTPEHAIQYIFYPQKSWPKTLTDYGITPDKIKKFKKQLTTWGADFLKDREVQEKKTNSSITELVDSDFDWFFAQTYDYIVIGNDPLTDKNLLNKFINTGVISHMIRSRENPDVLLMVAKDASESIQTTYIPPRNRIVNLGSTTTMRYNFLTESNEYITRNNNYTIREGGFTETTKDVNVYYELTMLDAKRIKDSLQMAPPIIWQFKYTRHAVNPTFDLQKELLTVTTWALKCNPTWNKKVPINIMGKTSIITCENSKIVNTDKEVKSALKPGDTIVKYKYHKKSNYIKADGIDSLFFTENPYDTFYRCVIVRDGKKITLKDVNFKKNKYFRFEWWK